MHQDRVSQKGIRGSIFHIMCLEDPWCSEQLTSCFLKLILIPLFLTSSALTLCYTNASFLYILYCVIGFSFKFSVLLTLLYILNLDFPYRIYLMVQNFISDPYLSTECQISILPVFNLVI